MKKFLLAALAVFSLISGVVSGVAYERYANREECLKITFSENPVDLNQDEIEKITQALNAEIENNGELVNSQKTASNNENEQQGGKFVGSRNSNKFYPVDCRYAKLIKEENKVFFETVEEGEGRGRTYVECK